MLRKNKGDQLYAQNISRQQITSRMAEEKNKLKYMQTLVREKQNDLSNALSFSKILEMENRIKELQKEQVETDRKLNMLEGLRKKQITTIEKQNDKE